MKLKNFKYLSLILVLIAGVFFYNDYTKVDYDQVRLKHSEFLKNSPFKATKNLPKDQRKKMVQLFNTLVDLEDVQTVFINVYLDN